MRLRKYLDFSTILLITIIGLTGCGTGFSGALPTATAQPPLNPTDWPTAVPAASVPSPTPFPMITLVPTPTPTVRPASTPVSLQPAGTGADQLMTQASTAGGGLVPVTVALVTGNDVSIRQGPGENYAAVGTVQPGEMAAVFGKDQAGGWLYVLTVSELQGWLPTGTVRALGALEQVPVLPPNPVAARIAGPTPAATENPASVLAELKTVATAQVNVAGLNVRQGPGASYDRLDTLTRNDRVNILAVNPPRDWALIQMADGRRGWVALSYLTVDQATLAEAPVVKPSILAQAQAVEQAVQPAAVIQPISTGSSPAVIPASQPAPGLNNLTSIATAHINTNEVAVRPEPGTGHAPIDTITDNQENIDVLALDPSRQWALVQPAFSHTGWVSLSNLTVQGSLTNAPQAITAWVNSNAIEVRQGPGIYDGVVGKLAINNLVSVLGLDETHSWARVEPVKGDGFGWVPIQFLTFSEALADIPLAPTPSPAEQQLAAGQPSSSPFSPSRPLSQSKIVFQLASGGDIMVINPDGSGLYRLTHGIDPVLSPDGQTVAFTRWEGETGSLWLIDIDGSNERSILGFTKQAKGPAWSPDGTQIVLNYQHEGRLNKQSECVDLAKKKKARPPRNASDIEVNLKGNTPYLCWTIPPDPHWGLRVVNVTDGSFEDLDGGTYAFRPTWDPNQAWRIVDDGGMGLVSVDRNRNVPQPMTGDVEDGSPVFSPDGRYLALTAGQQGGSQGYDIYRLNADGSGRVRLTQTPLWVPVVPGNFKQWNNVSPAWSPDGLQIAFLTDRTGRWEIWVMNVDGSNQHPLFSDEVNNHLQFSYNFVDERVLSWR